MKKKQNIISVSGGKDSTALLLLAIEQDTPNLRAVFADTGNEHQYTYEYLHYLSEATGVKIEWIKADFSEDLKRKSEFVNIKWREQGISDEICDRAIQLLKSTGNPFLDLCVWKGRFPSTKARFCSEELKRNPIIEQVQLPLLEAGISIDSWQGVRADESASRANLSERECVGIFDSGSELWNYRPILQWSAEAVFAQHRKHGVKPNPLYSMGMGRVGCMPCIHARKDELLEIAHRFPGEIDRIAEWENLVSMASKRGKSTFFSLSNGRGDGVQQSIEWAKTSHGGTQYDIFRVLDNGPVCSSIYGLCE